MKTIGLACDHAGFELKEYVRGWLEAKGWAYKDFGTNSTASVDYPDYAHPLALAVESGECYPGDANVLVMPGRFINTEEADMILTEFFSTKFDGGRHQNRIDKIPVK